MRRSQCLDLGDPGYGCCFEVRLNCESGFLAVFENNPVDFEFCFRNLSVPLNDGGLGFVLGFPSFDFAVELLFGFLFLAFQLGK